MQESAFSFHDLEMPVPGATLAPGRHWVRGWVLPKSGGHFVDVRVRAQDRLFAGVHGLPRADLAAYFKTGRPHALAEYSVAVQLAPGPATLILEALDLEGCWREFHRTTHRVDAALSPVDFSVPAGPLHWHEFGRIMQLFLREQRRRPNHAPALVAREVVATVPYPRDLRHPHPPFIGHLDESAAVARAIFGRSPVLGFLFHQQETIRKVYASFDLHAWQTIEHHRPSPHVGAFYPQFASAQNAGLFGIIDAPTQLPDPLSVRVYAELADGSLHLCSVQRSHRCSGEEEKAPYPPRDLLTFAQSFAAVNQALAERGIVIAEGEELRREIVRLEDDFVRRAPRSLPPAVPLGNAPANSAAPVPSRILLATHNLNLEGAPLFLVDYAQALVQAGAKLTVASEADGPLGARFSALGAEVRIVDAGAIMTSPSVAEAEASIERLGRLLDFTAFDLVVANTFTTFWAVHAAKQAGRPALLYVHESNTPASFYFDRANPAIVGLVERAFGLADAVSFTTAATRGYHLDYGRPANHRLTPGWIDVARIDRWRRENPREAWRAKLGVQSGEWLVTNIGTVCERKGQHIFARAVDLLWRRRPDLAARTRFIMLGGGHTAFDASLADLLAQLARPNLTVHPATPDYLPYYTAAEVFVCSTFEESSPRVILEAMACGTPILSSNVHGIGEQVRAGQEALLVPAGDTSALADGLALLLSEPALAAGFAAAARARVRAEFDLPQVMPRHLALACELAARPR